MTSEERKLWEKNQRRERIIDIAEKIYLKKGHENVTIDEIAKAAGYNKRTLYLYFKDKEELLLSVVLRGQIVLRDFLTAALEDSGKDASNMKILARAFYRFSLCHPDYLNLIMIYEFRTHRYYSEPNGGDQSPCEEKCREISDNYGDIVVQAIERDMQQGRIKSDLTPTQLMLILWGEVFGVMQIILMRRYKFNETYGIDAEELFNRFVDMTEKGLR